MTGILLYTLQKLVIILQLNVQINQEQSRKYTFQHLWAGEIIVLMGSSIVRCFCSYYDLIIWLISTRWPQRRRALARLDLLKLSLSEWFTPGSIHLYGSAQRSRRWCISAGARSASRDNRTSLLLSERGCAIGESKNRTFVKFLKGFYECMNQSLWAS